LIGLQGIPNPITGTLSFYAVCVTMGISGTKTAGLFRRQTAGTVEDKDWKLVLWREFRKTRRGFLNV